MRIKPINIRIKFLARKFLSILTVVKYNTGIQKVCEDKPNPDQRIAPKKSFKPKKRKK